jgi:hypothetical protein
MLQVTRWLPLLLIAGVAACRDGSGPQPLDITGALSPNLPAQSSACYTPRFHVLAVPTGPTSFEGLVTGDLEGTVSLEFDASSVKFAGATVAISGKSHWSITGGVIPGLVTFDTEFENRNIEVDRPGSPATLFENIGTHRAVARVERANLSYRGTFTTVPSPRADHEYHGVICP